jgi:hypothetical protein
MFSCTEGWSTLVRSMMTIVVLLALVTAPMTLGRLRKKTLVEYWHVGDDGYSQQLTSL